MITLSRAMLFLIFFGVCGHAASADLPPEEKADIKYLLRFVENSGCIFIRNGSENDAEAAASHLRLKYKRGKRYFDTAEQFIDRMASESSWTGKKYTINCNGKIEESGVWLHRALAEHRRDRDAQNVEPSAQ